MVQGSGRGYVEVEVKVRRGGVYAIDVYHRGYLKIGDEE